MTLQIELRLTDIDGSIEHMNDEHIQDYIEALLVEKLREANRIERAKVTAYIHHIED